MNNTMPLFLVHILASRLPRLLPLRLCSATLMLMSMTVFAQNSHNIQQLQKSYEEVNNGRVFVVAHRGCWTAAPENSIASIDACIRMGVESAEIDVQLTKDNQLIVFHDGTLKRMTNGWGYVADHTLAELQQLNLYERDGTTGSMFSGALLTQHHIPTLEKVFERIRGKLMINLEIKSNHRHGFAETFNAAVALAKKMGVENHIFWKIPPVKRGQGSKNVPANKKLAALNTQGLKYIMPIVWQSERSFDQQITDFAGSGINSFETVSGDLDYWPLNQQGKVKGADKNRYMIVGVLPRWSAGLSDDKALFDPDQIWGKALDMGFDLIMTDRPEQLILYLEKIGKR